MRITMTDTSSEGTTYAEVNEEATTIEEVLGLVARVMRGIGYVFDGDLVIEERNEDG